MTARLIVSTRATLGAIRGGVVHSLDGSDESKAPVSRRQRRTSGVHFTDALEFFHPGGVAGVGLFKIGRLGHSLAYIRSSFHLVILSKYLSDMPACARRESQHLISESGAKPPTASNGGHWSPTT